MVSKLGKWYLPLEKEMATHSSVLAWRIPGMGEPGGLPSMGWHRVRHDWSDLAAAAATEVLLGVGPGNLYIFSSLDDSCPWLSNVSTYQDCLTGLLKQFAGSYPKSFSFIRSGMGPESLHFEQALRCCWSVWFGVHMEKEEASSWRIWLTLLSDDLICLWPSWCFVKDLIC